MAFWRERLDPHAMRPHGIDDSSRIPDTRRVQARATLTAPMMLVSRTVGCAMLHHSIHFEQAVLLPQHADGMTGLLRCSPSCCSSSCMAMRWL